MSDKDDNLLTELEKRLESALDLLSHAVVRDVSIMMYLGFPSYFFKHDAAYKSSGGPGPYVDMSLPAARAMVDERIERRKRQSTSEVVTSFWAGAEKYDYNAINVPLLAMLHESGINVDFVDVGANVGDTAMGVAEAMEALGIHGHVHTFEPGPVFELVRANAWLNRLQSRITPYNVAASDATGYLPMEILSGHTESGSIGGISKHYQMALGETRFVRTERLDDFLPSGRAYFIKIDAEGVDFSVVRGAKRLIDEKRAPIITLEFTPKYNSLADLDMARSLLRDYALFNFRGLDGDGFFNRFDWVEEGSFDEWNAAVAAAPHGWTDVAFISKAVVEGEPMKRFLESYQKNKGT